jgi:stage V sporulation protein SpoVS
MASIPLPALDVKTPQQPDLLSKFGQLQQLQNLRQQSQMQQQEAPLRMQALQQQTQAGALDIQKQQQGLKDQQAMTAAYTKWDGKNYDDLSHLALENGASGEAVQKIQQHALDVKMKYSQIAKDDAATGASNITTLIKKNDVVSGALAGVLQAPDDQLPQALTNTATQLAQKGLIDPQHVQMAQQIAASGDPAKIRQQLDIMRKGMLSDTQLLDEAQKKASTLASNTAASKNQAEIDAANRIGGVPGAPIATNATMIYAIPEDQRTPAQKLFIKGYEKNNDVTRIQPSAMRANVYMQMPQAVADPNNPGQTMYVTRKDAIGMGAPNSGDVKSVQATQKFFSPAGKGGQTLAAFNTVQNHLQLLGQAAEALGNGNITMLNDISQKYAKATGSAAPTNFDAVKNAAKGEVARALTGNVTVSEQEALDKDFNNASSLKQIQGVVQKYTQLIQGKKEVLHQQYTDGMNGKVSFDNAPSGTANDPFAQFGGKAH